MKDLVISSSVLILFVIMVRAILGKWIGHRLRYALWLIVAVRLALPFTLPGSPVSIMNLVPRMQDAWNPEANADWSGGGRTETGVGVPERDTAVTDSLRGEEAGGAMMLMIREGAAEVSRSDSAQETGHTIQNAATKRAGSEKLYRLLPVVWLAGAVCIGGYLLIINLIVWRGLRRARVPVSLDGFMPDGGKLAVYCCEKLASPCLFGLWRPAIYLNEKALSDKQSCLYAMAHERQHYFHKDHIWSFIRLILVAIYWFHPLVWIAAVLSARDCEFACDEGVTARITEEECVRYGRALLGQVPSKRGGLRVTVSTSMSGGARQLKQRLLAITHRRKTSVGAVLLTAAMLLLITGCTFTGADGAHSDMGKNETDPLSAENSREESGTDGVGAQESGMDGTEEQISDAEGTGGQGSGMGEAGEQESDAEGTETQESDAEEAAKRGETQENIAQTTLNAYTMFPDDRHGWALTKDHQILYTYEGEEQFSLIGSLPFAGQIRDAAAAGDASDAENAACFAADNDVDISGCFFDEKTAYFAGVSANEGEALLIRLHIMSEPEAGNENGQVLVSEHRTRIPLQEYYPCGNIFVSFADAQNGYLLVCSDPAAGQMAKHLYRTADGGDSFSFAADLSTVIKGYPSGMAFCDENTGYIGVSIRGESSAYLYGTPDGGTTWESVDVPVHTDARYADALAPVVFHVDGEAQMAVVLRTVGGTAGEESERYVLYENPHPAEFQTWQLVRVLPYEEVGSYSLSDQNTGYVIDESGMLRKWEYNGF